MTNAVKKQVRRNVVTVMVNKQEAEKEAGRNRWCRASFFGLLQSFRCYASCNNRNIFIVRLVRAAQVSFFVFAEEEKVQMEEACLMIVTEIGKGYGFFLKFLQRLNYELDVLLFLFAAEKNDALEKGVIIFFIKQAVFIRKHGSGKVDAFPLKMMVKELAQVVIE